MYSASVVLRVTSVWSLQHQRTGQEAKVMTYTVLDFTEVGSEEVEAVQLPAKSAST